MALVEKLKGIETFVCQHFEDLGLDDPVEEGIWEDYQALPPASLEKIQEFERFFEIELPEDIKELYTYKDGSGWFSLFPTNLHGRLLNFSLLTLDDIRSSKSSFQNRDALLIDFPDDFSPEELARLADNRIQPYLFHTRWFPFAVYADSCFLMMDFAPRPQGKVGQILCYLHDPDEVFYLAESLTALVDQLLTIHSLDSFND